MFQVFLLVFWGGFYIFANYLLKMAAIQDIHKHTANDVYDFF